MNCLKLLVAFYRIVFSDHLFCGDELSSGCFPDDLYATGDIMSSNDISHIIIAPIALIIFDTFHHPVESAPIGRLLELLEDRNLYVISIKSFPDSFYSFESCFFLIRVFKQLHW